MTNYTSGRATDFGTAIYGVFNGRSMSPDVLIGQEFINATGVTNFRTILNTAAGSPGDWQAATFALDNGDTSNGFFYRTSKIDFLRQVLVHVGGFSPNHPRAIQRFDIRLKNYSSNGASLACYSTHMKAQDSSTNDDEARRLLETQRIRADAQTLPADMSFLLAGDTNITDSASAEYQALVASQTNNAGRFFDPISRPGSWNNNNAFRFVHTQDPVGSGGMDDRFDQIILSASLIDGSGLDYLGNPAIPYSSTTWNDTNHSYRAWGNDGTSYNAQLTVTNNQMVGATIAQAIVNSTAGQGGHIPVFLDFRVPPKITSDAALDFGRVITGGTEQRTLSVSNSGDTALWSDVGIATLTYSLAAPAGFTAPAGSFSDAAGGGANSHTITLTQTAVGAVNASLMVNSNASDTPARSVSLSGTVIRHAAPSLAASPQTLSGMIDFGTHPANGFSDRSFSIYNVGFDGLQAMLDVYDATIAGPGAARFSLVGFAPSSIGTAAAGYMVHFDATGASAGVMYSATLRMKSRDQALPGGVNQPDLVLNLAATVAASPVVKGDFNANGVVDAADVEPFVAVLLGLDTAPAHIALADMNGDAAANGDDIMPFVDALH